MSLSELPLSYCTNVHPGRSVAEIEAGLDRFTVPIRTRFANPLAAGLWLAKPVIDELFSTSDGVDRFARSLANRGLTCHTLNAFPYGDFHDVRVKEKVYLPDWTTDQRFLYTMGCAKVLAILLGDTPEGSISTLPLGFKGLSRSPSFCGDTIANLIGLAVGLRGLHEQTGKLIRLAIEPEPLCVLETTAEAVRFFSELCDVARKAGAEEAVRTHIGLCYDVCHQAVEFEDVARSIQALDGAGVRINKLHLSCAIQLDQPAGNPEGRAALRRYIEPRYLHQTIARGLDGKIVRQTDLNEALIADPGEGFADAPAWRIHFHVPIDADRLGPLATTRPDLKNALGAVAKLSYAPHLEVETYTWEVLPGAGPNDLIDGLSRELTSASKMLDLIGE
ncbi:MAG TPA: metabolite traffic protein EboE [Tepidisphaeraceae bacterium]|nr:metabolite traffic protein EboE [Tepidisphaeraceae bacterium]